MAQQMEPSGNQPVPERVSTSPEVPSKDQALPATGDSGQARVPPVTAPGPSPAKPLPERPNIASRNLPPVLVKQTPPLPVRLSQLLWALSFAAGAVGIVYFFIIRPEQMPLISDAIQAVDSSRKEATYESAAKIVFWSIFAVVICLLAIQITLLVSFMNRKPGVRWWQLTTLIMQVVLYPVALELAARGPNGQMLQLMLWGQVGFVLLALLMSTLPPAIAWTARQHDVRRGPAGSDGVSGDL